MKKEIRDKIVKHCDAIVEIASKHAGDAAAWNDDKEACKEVARSAAIIDTASKVVKYASFEVSATEGPTDTITFAFKPKMK